MGKIIITEELKQVLTKIDNQLSFILLKDEIDDDFLLKTDKPINYLDLSHTNKGHISYLTKDRIDKIEQDDRDYWKIKLRYHARPGSVLKKLFSDQLHYSLEDFSIKFLSIVDKPVFRLELIKGSDISKYYNYKNYYIQNGNLGHSCMSHSPSKYFDIYVKNEDSINMLVMLNEDDKVMGRALVWNGDGFRLMDRIYVCNDIYEIYFRQWAKENGVYQKQFNNFKSPLHVITPNDESICKEFVINLNESKFDSYPYLDTFKWLDLKENKIYNYKPSFINDDFVTITDSMGGHLHKDFFGFDDITKEIYCYSEIVYIDYMDKNIYVGHLVYSHIFNRYIYADHYKRSNEVLDNIFNEQYDHLNDYDKIEERKKEIEEKKLNGNTLKVEWKKIISDGYILSTDVLSPNNEDIWEQV